ncbi:hypothetical protein GDO86_019187 [Hymenochirus boettgeri]|uniref:non-specific serine/threonine protein kinase n=1 Tax=Hymenochirus boettgeri TaxID=247094 RepID=A0A8T2I9I9_9PIPI|nr:hypothetical protein GDO86_019187 [Hymenochirus boettgeri]
MDVKLADFGFGNFYTEGQALNTWCGSPPYAAPEVFQGKEYEGPPLDVWSLGIVLYVLLCGTFPFDAPNLPTLRQRVLEGRFRIPYFMSQDCESLIRRMLAVDPAKRLTIAQIKQHRWLQISNYQPPPNNVLLPTQPCLQVLSIMQSLGIDRERTLQALHSESYNHYAAIYYLLLDRLREPRVEPPTAQRLPTCSNVPSPGISRVPVVCNPRPAPVDCDCELSFPLQSMLYLGEKLSEGPDRPCALVTPPVEEEMLKVSPSPFHSLESCHFPPWTPTPSGEFDTYCPPVLSAQSATPVLQEQGSSAQSSSLTIPFQEGRRASDTSLTQGSIALRQLRKAVRVHGLFSLSRIRGVNRLRGLRCVHGPLISTPNCRESKGMLQDVLLQQRLLQITVCPPNTNPPDPSPLLTQDASNQPPHSMFFPSPSSYQCNVAPGFPLQVGGQILTSCNADWAVQEAAQRADTHSCVLLA